jgi:hypothetical protein
MLHAKFSHSFISPKSKKPRFAFIVTGTPEELQEYIDSEGEHVSTNDAGEPLWYTSYPKKLEGTLKISSKGTAYMDTSDLDIAKAMIEANGGDFGQMYGGTIMQQILGQASQPATQVKPAEASSDDISKI